MVQIWESIPTLAQQVIIAVIAGVILWIVFFPVRQFITQQPEKRKEQDKKLRIHFEDINREIISHISEMARSLAIRNDRLVFGSYAPVGNSYPFEKNESYEFFELHFSEEAKEWKELNNKAVKLNEDVVNFFQSHQYSHAASKQNVANNYIKDLQQEFSNFAQRLARKVESIDKYEMGKEFKKHRKCPVCKKF